MAIARNILALVVSIHLCAGAMVNVALKKPATMSSIYVLDGNDWAARKGVDGDINAIILTDAHQEFAWWMVDLQTQVHGPTVKIYHQTSFNDRRNGEQVYTSMTPFSSYPGGQSCLNITGRADGTDIPDVISVRCSGRWRYIMVYTNTDNNGEGATLDFGEVEVLVCSNGTYGENCTKSCSFQCAGTSTSCDRYSGACLGGCKAGWRGTDCTRVCSDGTYGENCAKSCSSQCAGTSTSCDRYTGACLSGCQAGWRGADCTRVCSDGTYGENCAQSCSSQCAGTSTVCDRYTGACLGGCKAGWRGTNCTRACPSGTYGPNCTFACVTCAGDNICDHVTGNCLEESKSQKNASTGSDGCTSWTAGLIGGFVGVIVTLAVIGVVCVYLIRQGRLQWNVSKEPQQSEEMADSRVQANQSNPLSGSAQSEPAEVHDYCHLDGGTTLDNPHYDVIQKNYQNI